jgi:hypothetical protein
MASFAVPDDIGKSFMIINNLLVSPSIIENINYVIHTTEILLKKKIQTTGFDDEQRIFYLT